MSMPGSTDSPNNADQPPVSIAYDYEAITERCMALTKRQCVLKKPARRTVYINNMIVNSRRKH